jgi:hypothetical protein
MCAKTIPFRMDMRNIEVPNGSNTMLLTDVVAETGGPPNIKVAS